MTRVFAGVFTVVLHQSGKFYLFVEFFSGVQISNYGQISSAFCLAYHSDAAVVRTFFDWSLSNAMSKIPLHGLSALAPVERETAQDRVYNQLRNMLIRGAFDAGEQFLANEIAERMSVSSMPVREALARLVSERALEAMPNRRIRVPLITLERSRDISRARILVEGELLRLAMAGISRADISRLEALTFEFEETKDPTASADLNHEFHFGIYGRAGSPALHFVAESLWMQAGPFAKSATNLSSIRLGVPTAHYHFAILQGIRENNPEKAMLALAEDIKFAHQIVEAGLGDFADNADPSDVA